MSNKFDIYSSKVKRVNIPIPGFKFFHKASSEEEVDPKFIGREQISDKLYSWLKDDPKGGSYLVTGFRGMGKSSFVGRVLNQLIQRSNPCEYFFGVIFFLSIIALRFYFNIFIFVTIVPFALCVMFILSQNKIKNEVKYCKFRRLIRKEAQKLEESGNYDNFKKRLEGKEKRIDWKYASHVLHREYNKNRSYKRICVNVNLGQEVLNEREVLSLISHKLYIKYREFVFSPIANFERWLIYIGLSVLISFPLGGLFKFINESLIIFECFREDYTTCVIYVDDLLKDVLFLLITFIALYVIAMRFSSSQINILKRLRFLNQRLDAQLTFDERYGSKVDYGPSFLRAGFKKKRVYGIANVREIEQELIDVMDNISKGMNMLPEPSIVFIFDELDKVDSNSLSGTSGESQAEFSNEKNFPGGGTTRKRKQNVLHLLANMKLFVSTAKAKFIFISGRELYDAYLADLSDREFAVSSIFSGVIYVDSFCVNEHKGKDVMSNVETYICKQLIPNDYIERQFARYYAMQIVNGAAFERFDINLKLYYQYLIDVYRGCLDESFLQPFIEEEGHYYNEKELRNYLCRSYIDKAVNLLYHFSVYLYHISNGSPKKMMLYFEKYVKKCYDKGQSFMKLEQDDFSSPNPDGDINILAESAPNYYLSFGYTDQRKIGFIHYLSYPVNQILVNANQYSDKLLVSVSFLVDHIYKFHNGGFSWRNLEYTPELLEVYKIPGFRSFINSIISYLQQTHLIAITCGLFQFKFRKQIAEEISLASKFSEEIAALFNFTLDESLNVKQHYSEIRNTYLELEGRGDEQTPKHTPRLNIGLHNILGDLYMFDEEFNNAIFEYHAAIKELEKEMGEKQGDYPDLRNTLYSIQLLLKLGLANEKRNTNESALNVYSELVAKLIDFRHFDEKKLQLTYRLRKQLDWPPYEGVLVPLKYDSMRNLEFNEVHPRIINGSDDILHHTGMPFMASGKNLSTAFAHLLTPPKYAVMQRLSLFQDSRLIYQALLAKLFVKEKIGLGGITMTDIETIESEYYYLNLATNTSEKFLSSSDFFRRLGDIMFYKNGLTVTTPNDNHNNEDISFMDGLYYWGYDIKRELLDFCNVNNCYEYYETLLKVFVKIKNRQIENRSKEGTLDAILYTILLNLSDIIDRKERIFRTERPFKQTGAWSQFLSLYFDRKSPHVKLLKLIPKEEVIACNKHRHAMFRCNKPVPCLACNYYSRSMRILMRGMFNCEILEKRKGKNCSVFIIMEKLLVKGTSRSLRQDYVIQLAEILDCRANVLLSCATGNDNCISSTFLKDFLSFIESIGRIDPCNFNENIKKAIDELDNKYGKQISKVEECIIYYWEASKCFSIANDLMKASASLKKILRVFQNYLKTSNGSKERIRMISDNIEEIKKVFVKPNLIYLYSHYNNINFAEIQKLKWVFSIQTYEDIPFNRLSLFPDVEQILLIYYDLLRRCAIDGYRLNIHSKTDRMPYLLSRIYRNTTLGSLRQDSTIYERVMALRFKTLMNGDFLHRLGLAKDLYYQKKHEEGFVYFFLRYIGSNADLTNLLGEYKNCFRFALGIEWNNISEPGVDNGTEQKLAFLEFLIKDSLFCLTRILEIITPHTSSTLFSNSFYGEIYQMVYEWHMLFDELFLAYKYFENRPDVDSVGHSTYKYLIKVFDGIDKKGWAYTMVEEFFKERYKKQKEPLDSERFFNETTHEISKAQANYTFAKYSLAMAKESYERALQMHHEGKAYKDMISQMYYLDDDLKNDTIQISTAIERYKINNGYIQEQLTKIQGIIGDAPMYEIDNYANENMNNQNLEKRFYLQHRNIM